jgi:hypothetical protein
MIQSFRFPGRMIIDSDLEALLLKEFRNEPYPYEYSEQDLYEQVRKYIMCYNREHGVVPHSYYV